MGKNFHYKVYTDILTAARINNTIMACDKMSLLDCNILCLARSFHDSNKQCYMTNEQLASTFLACERTIKSSLNRLYWQGLLSHQEIILNGSKKRIIKYEPEAVEQFIQKMMLAGKNFT